MLSCTSDSGSGADSGHGLRVPGHMWGGGMTVTQHGLDAAQPPNAVKARAMLQEIGGTWWNVYIGGPEAQRAWSVHSRGRLSWAFPGWPGMAGSWRRARFDLPSLSVDHRGRARRRPALALA